MAHEAQGELVREWRLHKGLSQKHVAAYLDTRKPRISNFESARREIEFEIMRDLDDLFEAGGALFDMAQALGTPFALPARRSWVFHPETARPVVAQHFGKNPAPSRWVLLRSSRGHDPIEAALSWGTMTFDISVRCDERGVFVQLPADAEPATIAVQLKEAGWVDQGRGPAPTHLGQPILDLPADPRLRGRATRTGANGGIGLLAVDTPCAAQRFRLSGAAYRKLRKGRCYILDDVAKWATALLPDWPVTIDAIRGLENGADPRGRFFRSRLDVVYEAGGYMTGDDDTVDIHGARKSFELTIPGFWVGPVWIRFLSDEPRADVHIWQGPHQQVVRVVRGACVVDERRRRDAGTYVVRCPPGWTVKAGLGARPGAAAVNLDRGIQPAMVPARSRLTA